MDDGTFLTIAAVAGLAALAEGREITEPSRWSGAGMMKLFLTELT